MARSSAATKIALRSEGNHQEICFSNRRQFSFHRAPLEKVGVRQKTWLFWPRGRQRRDVGSTVMVGVRCSSGSPQKNPIASSLAVKIFSSSTQRVGIPLVLGLLWVFGEDACCVFGSSRGGRCFACLRCGTRSLLLGGSWRAREGEVRLGVEVLLSN